MKELVYVNRSNKDYCEVSDLVPNWETILANYMYLMLMVIIMVE